MEPWADQSIEHQCTLNCILKVLATITQPKKLSQTAFMSTLFSRAKNIADVEHLPAELVSLREFFTNNGFSKKERNQVIASHGKRKATMLEEEVIKGLVVISYYSTISNRLSCLLWCKGIKTVARPLVKIRHVLQPIQDSLGFRVPGIYKIPCACWTYYIGQMGQSVLVRQQEHQSYIRLGHTDRSALAEHKRAYYPL